MDVDFKENINSIIIDKIECINLHNRVCADKQLRKCAICLAQFRFIANNPIQLKCGHCACTQCEQDVVKKVLCEKDNEGPVQVCSDSNGINQYITDNIFGLFNFLNGEFLRIQIIYESKIQKLFIEDLIISTIFLYIPRHIK
jgi:hypothetical protein